jgi:glutathione S-transferase
MKLLFSPTSPYVRKCLVTATEVGVMDRITFQTGSAHPVNRDAAILTHNPLGKVPTLITDDGQALFDSRVICEYLNHLGSGPLLPEPGPVRWQARMLEALGDGILDAALLIRYEANARPEALRWTQWVDGKLDAMHTSLSHLNATPGYFEQPFHLGLLTVGCALWYLDLRFPELKWRERYPVLAKVSQGVMSRPSMKMSWSAT